MVRLVHHRLCHVRRRTDPLERGDPAGAAFWTVHAAGVELDDTLGVGPAPVADARVLRVQLDDVDAGDQRIQHVVTSHDATKRQFDTGLGAPVTEPVSVGRRDDDWARCAAADDVVKTSTSRTRTLRLM